MGPRTTSGTTVAGEGASQPSYGTQEKTLLQTSPYTNVHTPKIGMQAPRWPCAWPLAPETWKGGRWSQSQAGIIGPIPRVTDNLERFDALSWGGEWEGVPSMPAPCLTLLIAKWSHRARATFC